MFQTSNAHTITNPLHKVFHDNTACTVVETVDTCMYECTHTQANFNLQAETEHNGCKDNIELFVINFVLLLLQVKIWDILDYYIRVVVNITSVYQVKSKISQQPSKLG